MRIRCAGRHRSSGVAPAHRTHVPRGEAGDASARGDAEGGWTCAARQCSACRSTLGLNGEEFSLGVAGYADAHSRHVVRNEERVLALTRLHGAIAGTL